jgi:large subunit ribosomal protein L34e
MSLITMVKRSYRTSKKRKYTSPGGSKRIEYHKRKHVKLKCSSCGKELLGVPTSMKKKSRTMKVPNRPFAGILCSSCSRKRMKEEVIKKIRGGFESK